MIVISQHWRESAFSERSPPAPLFLREPPSLQAQQYRTSANLSMHHSPGDHDNKLLDPPTEIPVHKATERAWRCTFLFFLSFFFFFFAVLVFELRAYTLSHSTSPFL
jgi:hypothetical protein